MAGVFADHGVGQGHGGARRGDADARRSGDFWPRLVLLRWWLCRGHEWTFPKHHRPSRVANDRSWRRGFIGDDSRPADDPLSGDFLRHAVVGVFDDSLWRAGEKLGPGQY
ncbi:hypothetical protein D3C72_1582330 [compost metagenome]